MKAIPLLLIMMFTGTLLFTSTSLLADELRPVDTSHVTKKQQVDAIASRLLTWTTGSAFENDYVSVGRLANFFGFIKMRVSSDHTLSRAAVGQAAWGILNSEQQVLLIELLTAQKENFTATIDSRMRVNRMLESMLTVQPVTYLEFETAYIPYAVAEAQLGRVLATGLGQVIASLDERQLSQLSQARADFVKGTPPKSKKSKIPKLDKADHQELMNLTSRLLAWSTGTPEDNDFETVGKPSQHFGFVSLRVDSNHAVKRGDVSKKVQALFNKDQAAWVKEAVEIEVDNFADFLTARAKLMRYFETAQTGSSLDANRVKTLATEVAKVEAAMTYNQATTMIKIRNSMDADTINDLIALKDSYIVDADPVEGEEQLSELAAQQIRGKQLYAQCVICHANEAVAPSLIGLPSRLIASVKSFSSYSPAMNSFAQTKSSWTSELFLQFIKSPKALVPGTSMGFKGLQSETDRVILWRYLESLMR